MLLYKFVYLLAEFVLHVPQAKEADIILGVLSLIDVCLTGNLILTRGSIQPGIRTGPNG